MRLKHLLPALFLLLAFHTQAQTKDTLLVVRDTIRIGVIDTTHWTKTNTVGFDLNEIAFVNWNAGGVSSISGLLRAKFVRRYENANIKWSNEMILRYGMNKQDGIEFRKTDDMAQFSATFGYRKDTLSHWYYSTKFNFNTQFSEGYEYPNTKLSISGPFAPAYTFFGLGAEYSSKEPQLNVYLSPSTVKNTLVLNQRLANQGAFGVKPGVYDANGVLLREGQQSKTEFGMLVTAAHKTEVYKNINMENRLVLYSDYLNKFGNVDVDWQFMLDMIVNKYVKANIGSHIIYDDDIKAKEEIDGVQVVKAPRVQWKQMLGIGLEYNF